MLEACNYRNATSILAELFQLKHQVNDEWPRFVHKEHARQMMLAVGAELLSALMARPEYALQQTRMNHFLNRMK